MATTAGSLQRRPLVLADAVPGRHARDAAFVTGGALLTAALAQVALHVPPSPVPVTGQTLAVVLVGAGLGARRGAAALALYLLLGLFLPFYADGGSGASVVWGPSGGYLLGFVLAAFVVGAIAERGGDRRVAGAFAAFVAGQLVVFGFGLAGLRLAVGESWSWTVHNGFTVFIAGGLIKAAIAAAIIPSAWQIVGGIESRWR
ncbi:MAG TPA: biotin transporter BioY [Solirubrobacteraceae bacterium]|nr:biotin transporter BioY [Solirubrobacteraceae bacterium]